MALQTDCRTSLPRLLSARRHPRVHSVRHAQRTPASARQAFHPEQETAGVRPRRSSSVHYPGLSGSQQSERPRIGWEARCGCFNAESHSYGSRSLSDIDRSTTANDPHPPASFSARKNPQCIPANTPPVFSGLRPCIRPCLFRLVTKAMLDRLLAVSAPKWHYVFPRRLAVLRRVGLPCSTITISGKPSSMCN